MCNKENGLCDKAKKMIKIDEKKTPMKDKLKLALHWATSGFAEKDSKMIQKMVDEYKKELKEIAPLTKEINKQ